MHMAALKRVSGIFPAPSPRRIAGIALDELRRRSPLVVCYLCFLLGVTLIWLPGLSLAQNLSQTTDDLDSLLQQKQYIELDRVLTVMQGLSPFDRAFFTGVMANRKNQVAGSVRLLEPLVPRLVQSYSSRTAIALCTLADDYAKTFRYAEAADTFRLLSRMPGYTEEPNGCHAEREAGRWELLRQAPVQTTIVAAPFTLQVNRMPFGLLDTPVHAGTFSDYWVLDTGANISAVTRTVAQQLGLQLSEATTTAQGSSGLLVPIHTAVIPELRLGEATIHNVAVMVFEDKDLDFPELSYPFHGSIGFPVLASLGRITFHSDGRFSVQEPAAATGNNPSKLYLEKLTPLVAAKVEGEEDLLTLDTGASGTYLSAEYYAQHRQEFSARDQSMLQLVGAGGSKVIPAYKLANVSLNIGGACVVMPQIEVLTESTGNSDEFAGNVGQTAVGKLRSYTLDFRNMTFAAENQPGGNGCAVAD
jgi:hypothetical protein